MADPQMNAKMPRKRGNPIAQVGNYAAPVDTEGMDPEMKNLMGVDKPRPAKPPNILQQLFAKAKAAKKPAAK